MCRHVFVILCFYVSFIALGIEVRLPSKKSRLSISSKAQPIQDWDDMLSPVPWEAWEDDGEPPFLQWRDQFTPLPLTDLVEEKKWTPVYPTRRGRASDHPDHILFNDIDVSVSKSKPMNSTVKIDYESLDKQLLDHISKLGNGISRSSDLEFESEFELGLGLKNNNVKVVTCPYGWIAAGDICLTLASITPATDCVSFTSPFNIYHTDEVINKPGICERIVMKTAPQLVCGDFRNNVNVMTDDGKCASSVTLPELKCPKGAELSQQPLNPYAFRDKHIVACVHKMITKGRLVCPDGFRLHNEPYRNLKFGDPISPDDPVYIRVSAPELPVHPHERAGPARLLLREAINEIIAKKTPLCTALLAVDAENCSKTKCESEGVKEILNKAAWWAYSVLYAEEDKKPPKGVVPGF